MPPDATAQDCRDGDSLRAALELSRAGRQHAAVACLEQALAKLPSDDERSRARLQAHLLPLLAKLRSDPHLALQCPPGASKAQVRRAYLKLARSFHPDKQGGGTALFQAIQGAFAALQADPACMDRRLPLAPTDLRATRELDGLTVAWRAPPRAGGLVRFQVEVHEGGEGAPRVVAVLEPRLRVTALCPGQAYTFRVRAACTTARRGKGGAVEWSAPATTTYREPMPVVVISSVQLLAEEAAIHVAWGARLRVELQWRQRWPDGSGSGWTPTRPPQIVACECRKRGVSLAGQRVGFRVRAVNAIAAGPWSAEAWTQCSPRAVANATGGDDDDADDALRKMAAPKCQRSSKCAGWSGNGADAPSRASGNCDAYSASTAPACNQETADVDARGAAPVAAPRRGSPIAATASAPLSWFWDCDDGSDDGSQVHP